MFFGFKHPCTFLKRKISKNIEYLRNTPLSIQVYGGGYFLNWKENSLENHKKKLKN